MNNYPIAEMRKTERIRVQKTHIRKGVIGHTMNFIVATLIEDNSFIHEDKIWLNSTPFAACTPS